LVLALLGEAFTTSVVVAAPKATAAAISDARTARATTISFLTLLLLQSLHDRRATRRPNPRLLWLPRGSLPTTS
jgi:hypothetical protein